MKRARQSFACLAVSAAALVASPLMAAESGEAKQGLPQLNVALYPEHLFWLAVCFALLYVLMSRIALPGVQRAIDNRQQTIATELAAATQASEQAKAMIAQYEKALADARSKAQETVNTIKADAARQATEKQAAQHKELTERLHAAEAKIAAVRDASVAEVKGAASGLAQAIVERMTSAKPASVKVR